MLGPFFYDHRQRYLFIASLWALIAGWFCDFFGFGVFRGVIVLAGLFELLASVAFSSFIARLPLFRGSRFLGILCVWFAVISILLVEVI